MGENTREKQLGGAHRCAGWLQRETRGRVFSRVQRKTQKNVLLINRKSFPATRRVPGEARTLLGFLLTRPAATASAGGVWWRFLTQPGVV